MARRLVAAPRRRSPLVPVQPAGNVCLELEDNSALEKSAVELFGTKHASDPQAQAARLTDQFLTQNRPVFDRLEVSVRRDYDGAEVRLHVESANAVGAAPLISPFTAKPDYGLVVQPRFPWAGLGPMLGEMGWLVSPEPLRLPLLKRSERRVPPWVISVMVLARLDALLHSLERRFELTEQLRTAPKGSVRWPHYAARSLPRGQFLAVPCRFPDLRDDRRLQAAIRYTLERQIQSLESQREHGAFVHQLIARAEALLGRVRFVAACPPSPRDREAWLRRPLPSAAFLEGIQAIDWTVDERGLAGVSDLEGIPWTMPMERFFEAWVETLLSAVAHQTGGILRTARQQQTTAPLVWEPPYTGSQKSLQPDFVLELEGHTLVVDAKYKRHWEEVHRGRRYDTGEALRESHRQDLLQVLAYANLANSPAVVCCLVYPCSTATWESLGERRRLIHAAELSTGSRRLLVWLTAAPMSAPAERIAGRWAQEIRGRLFASRPN